MTWAYVLEDGEHGSTRLIVRARAGPGYRFHGLPWWATKRIVAAIHFVMQRRAESDASAHPSVRVAAALCTSSRHPDRRRAALHSRSLDGAMTHHHDVCRGGRRDRRLTGARHRAGAWSGQPAGGRSVDGRRKLPGDHSDDAYGRRNTSPSRRRFRSDTAWPPFSRLWLPVRCPCALRLFRSGRRSFRVVLRSCILPSFSPWEPPALAWVPDAGGRTGSKCSVWVCSSAP